MIKRFKQILIIAVTLYVGLGAAAQAAIYDIPANALLNNNHLYVIDNTNSKVEAYRYNSSSWVTYDLPSPLIPLLGAQSFGLALKPDASRLYVGANNGASSQILSYALVGGMPSGSRAITGPYFSLASSSSPAGMVIGGNNRLFVADHGIGRVLVFNVSTTPETFVKAISDVNIAGKANLCGVAVSSTTANTYKVYISRKSSVGEIYIYEYNTTNDTFTYKDKIDTGLTNPTYLKVAGSKLYVAIKGTGGAAIKVYTLDINGLPVNKTGATVLSDVAGSYGWNGFDISADGAWLVFKKAQNSAAISNKLYKIRTADISGTVTAEEMASYSMISDSVVISSLSNKIIAGDSKTSTITVTNETLVNQQPEIDPLTSLRQYKLDGTTEIAAGGTTNQDQIIVSFSVSDIDNDELTPRISYRVIGTSPYTNLVLDTIPAGTTLAGATVTATIPVDGYFGNGQYEWKAGVRDSHMPLSQYTEQRYNDNTSRADFIVNAPLNDPPGAFGKISPIDNSEAAGAVTLVWEESVDPNGDTVNYKVWLSDAVLGTIIPTPDPTTETSYTVPADTLTIGTTYRWAVVASDGRATTNADATSELPLGQGWVFEYVETLSDTTAPAAIDDLRASVGDNLGDVNLIWTAPGDDIMDGTVSSYEVRYRKSLAPIAGAITEGNFGARSQYDTSGWAAESAFATGDTVENRIMGGITSNAGTPTYIYVAIKSYDDAVPANRSTISNIAFTFIKDNTFQMPTVTNIYPKRGPTDEAVTIAIEGTYFVQNGTIVSLNDANNTTLTNVVFRSAGLIEATIPASALAAGTYDVSATTPGGKSAPNANARYTATAGHNTVKPQATGISIENGNGQVTLGWKYPNDNDMAEVKVLRSAIDAGSYPEYSDVPPTATVVYPEVGQSSIPKPGITINDIIDDGLTNDHAYHYVVYLRDTSGNSSIVNVGNNAGIGTPGISDTTAPAAIDDLSASVGVNLGDVNITWTAVADDGSALGSGAASSYTIRYKYSDTQPTDLIGASVYASPPTPGTPGNTENLTMNNADLQARAGEQIWVTIVARDNATPTPNESAQGNWATTIVKNFVPAPTITKVYPRKGPNDAATHIVIIGTNLYNDMIATIGDTPLLSVHQDSDTMVQADIPAGLANGIYEIIITCPGGTYDDAAGTNPDNNFRVITPGTDTTSPETVTDFDASDDADTQSDLSWTNPANTDLRQVIVLRKEGSYPTDHEDAAAVQVYQTMIPEPGANVSHTDDNGVAADTIYYYAVFSRDTSDNWNDTVDFTAPDVNADTRTPGGGGVVNPPSALAISIVNENQARLDWTASTTPDTMYNVYRDTTPFFTPAPENRIAVSVSEPTYIDTASGIGNISANYFYLVTATYGANESEPSNRVGEFDFQLVHNDPGSNTSYNWLPIPFENVAGPNGPITTASALWDNIGVADNIDNYDPVSQGYDQSYFGVSDVSNFAISAGKCYRVSATGNRILTLIGGIPDTQTFTLVFNNTDNTSYNWVYLPFHRPEGNAASLYTDVGISDNIDHFDPAGQNYDQSYFGIPDVSNFSVKFGECYRVSVTSSGNW